MIVPPHNSWLLARLLAGGTLNGELETVSGPFAAITRRLAGLPPEGRQGAWDAFLDGREDREEIILAIASTDPNGPSPEAIEDPEAEDDWAPIRLGTIPPAEPFPLDLLPYPARDLAESAARAIGCPVDFPAVACLAAASAVIGRSVSLLVKSGYFESVSLYLALVGDSSDGKSPALDIATAPIRFVASQLHEEYQTELAAWTSRPPADQGERPKSRRIDTSNPTVEALAPILSNNPRGLIVLPDEFLGLLMSMGQYKSGKGGDKQFYLSAWSGSRLVVDRVKDLGNPTVVSRPFLTLAGGMTPGRLGKLAADGGDEDGFMNRLLFAYPEPVTGRRYSEEGICEAVADEWKNLIDRLWSRPMRDLDGKPAPHVVTMTPEARTLWATKCQAHLDEQEEDDFPRSLRGAWGKLQSYAARLALILACIHQAGDPTADHLASPTVDALVIHDAWRLVAYFKSHARRVYSAMRGRFADGGVGVRVLVGWITRNRREQFSTRDAKKDIKLFRDDPSALEDTLRWMVARNIVRPQLDPDSLPKRTGRKPTPKYETNPGLWDSLQYGQNGQNRQNESPDDHSEGSSDSFVCSDVDSEVES